MSVRLSKPSATAYRLLTNDSGNDLSIQSSDSVDGSAYTTRFNIQQNGNVGIGTNSPLGKIHSKEGTSGVTSISSNFDQLVLEDDLHSGMHILSGASQDGAIYFGSTNGSSQGQLKYFHASDSFAIYTNDIERMRIDSAGRVTMPQQPMCWLDGNTGSTAYSAGNTLKSFNDSLNGGMTWNSVNGRITVPVNGWYQWNFFIYGYSAGGSRTQLFHNGIRRALAHGHVTASNDFTNSASIVLPMAANDYIHLTTDYTGNIYMGPAHSGISGHLIG
jgi:hypothetical protein